MPIEIKKYSPEDKTNWNQFVGQSKNGTFLFHRDFMEYHSDRFTDNSLLFYQKSKLVALIPANKHGEILYSHQGLTYGGLILDSEISTQAVLLLFDTLKKHLIDQGFRKLIYKTVPHIYHKQPAEEDLYALFRNEARLTGRSISSCITNPASVNYSELRKRGIKKAIANNLSINETSDYSAFWQILDQNLLSKYNVKPVHSLEEISFLNQRFPDNIRLFEVLKKDKTVLGGCVIFEMPQIAHVQYISANEEGREIGALDYLFDQLLTKVFVNKLYFDFGISTEKNGTILNEGLISQKEGFGAKGIVYDMYELELNIP